MALGLMEICGLSIVCRAYGPRHRPAHVAVARVSGLRHVLRMLLPGTMPAVASGYTAATQSRQVFGTEIYGSSRTMIGLLSSCMVDPVAGEPMLLFGIRTQTLSGCMAVQQVPNFCPTCGNSPPVRKDGTKCQLRMLPPHAQITLAFGIAQDKGSSGFMVVMELVFWQNCGPWIWHPLPGLRL